MIMTVLMAVSEELNVTADKLLHRVGEGDAESLAELYKLCGKAVYSYALAMTHSTYDAEDVLHETFLSLCRSAADYKSHGKAMAYIFTVTRNHCLKVFEKGNRTADLPEEDFLPYIAESDAVSSEDRLLLEQCMGRLDETERRIIIMHVVWGFKHREVASLLGLGLSTVISKYNRALKKLKNVLEESAESEESK